MKMTRKKITRKTKMLSTLRAFSIRYPVRNSNPRCAPNHQTTPALKSNASAIQKRLQPSASRGPTACAFRWKTPRSRASRPRTKRVNAPHNSGVPTVAGIDQPPWGKAAQKTCRRASAAVMSGCEGLAPARLREPGRVCATVLTARTRSRTPWLLPFGRSLHDPGQRGKMTAKVSRIPWANPSLHARPSRDPEFLATARPDRRRGEGGGVVEPAPGSAGGPGRTAGRRGPGAFAARPSAPDPLRGRGDGRGRLSAGQRGRRPADVHRRAGDRPRADATRGARGRGCWRGGGGSSAAVGAGRCTAFRFWRSEERVHGHRPYRDKR